MAPTLHHVKNTRSLRPLWLLEELGADYTLIDEGPDTRAIKTDAYRAINPLGKVPCFTDGPVKITESVAIIQYIAALHGGSHLTRTASDDDYGNYLQLMYFGEAGMGGYVNMLITHTALLPEAHRNPAIAKWAAGEMETCLAYLDSTLGSQDHLLGAFSLADISVTYVLFLMKITRNAGGLSESVNAYFKRCTGRDAWQRACAK